MPFKSILFFKAFGAVKEEIRSAQTRNYNKKRNFHKKSDNIENVVVTKRGANGK